MTESELDPDRRIGRLLELGVVDLALIDRLQLEFGPGLNVLTGETGAGKSLVIDALGLALGMRADTTLVRHGAESARVQALFDRSPEPLICVREVSVAGRSTARLDDEAVTAARLADVAGRLVEIHGQHDQQRLLDEREQRELLDSFGGHEAERRVMAVAVGRWRENRVALEALAIDPRELARRLEMAEHEADEIDAARLSVGEAAQIAARLQAAQHGEALARGGAELSELLVGDGTGARDVLGQAVHVSRELARLDPRVEPLAGRLEGLAAEAEDVAATARDLLAEVEHDPVALGRLEERLSRIYALERRYGEDEAAVIAYGEHARSEAGRLRGVEAERERRRAEDGRLLTAVAEAASVLSGRRLAAATGLTSAVNVLLEGLGFPAGVFEVAVGRRPAAADEPAVEIDGDALAFDGSGIDSVVFRLAPNPGEPPRPLARIASGGELSRVALAIKQVLAEADDTPTLVFDEIDSGIGGRSADPVGWGLRELGRRHQVLCVTHLPQIAAHADVHFRISKRERDGRTVTEVSRLDRAERIVELAQMLGGPNGGPAALAGAKELLERAEARHGDGVGDGDRAAGTMDRAVEAS